MLSHAVDHWQVSPHQDAYSDQLLWMAMAQATSFPWPARDERLVAQREQLLVGPPEPPEHAEQASSSQAVPQLGQTFWRDKTVQPYPQLDLPASVVTHPAQGAHQTVKRAYIRDFHAILHNFRLSICRGVERMLKIWHSTFS